MHPSMAAFSVLCVPRLSAIGWLLLCVDYDVMLTALLAETTLPSEVQSSLRRIGFKNRLQFKKHKLMFFAAILIIRQG